MIGSSRRVLRVALRRPCSRGASPLMLEQVADTVRRPEAQEGLAFYVLLRYGTEEARVAGVRPVVSHHEVVPFGYRRRGERAPVRELLVHVGFYLALAVHEERAAPDRDLVPRN